MTTFSSMISTTASIFSKLGRTPTTLPTSTPRTPDRRTHSNPTGLSEFEDSLVPRGLCSDANSWTHPTTQAEEDESGHHEEANAAFFDAPLSHPEVAQGAGHPLLPRCLECRDEGLWWETGC